LAFKSEEEEPDKAARDNFNKEQEMKIQERINQFVMPDNPGAKFKKNFDKMLSKLELPQHIKDQLNITTTEEEVKNEDIDYLTLLKGGRYYLIPSFFALVKELKNANRDFAIVFRSFGTELKPVIAEFNAYELFRAVGCVKESMFVSME